MTELLPIGSIVLLHKTNKPVMIYGFNQIHSKTGEHYDYIACLYPEGSLDTEYSLLFSHHQIEKVLHQGPVLALGQEVGSALSVAPSMISPKVNSGETADDFI